jgi:RHS repeat-associated protein
VQFVYSARPATWDKNVVESKHLVDGGTWTSAWTYSDGFGRVRETQSPSSNGTGGTITATQYDTSGRVTIVTDPFWDSLNSASGTSPITGSGFGTAPLSTRTSYDNLGRVSSVARDASGTQQFATTTAYDGLKTTTTPPVGGQVIVETDGLGRTVKHTRRNHAGGTGALTTYGLAPFSTTYEYNAVDVAVLVTNHNGNTTVTTPDWLGRPVSVQDPDNGTTTYTYNASGSVATINPASGNTETYFYDALNRPATLWVGGYKRREWFYDATGEKGLLNKTTEYNYTGATPYSYTIDITSYDSRNRPNGTSYIIPAQAGVTDGLDGTYTFTNTYTPDDQIKTLTYPSVADIVGNETVNHTFKPNGAPWQQAGWEWYEYDTSYHGDSRLYARKMGPPAAGGATASLQVIRKQKFATATGRLEELESSRGSGQIFQYDKYWYDNDGNISAIAHDPDGTTSDHTECFAYNPVGQLEYANTTSILNNCSGGYNGLGPNPYIADYNYNEIGNITTGPAGTYTYPTGSSATRPHAPTAAGSTSYTYDAAGRRATSTTDGVTTTYTWNAPGDRLAQIDRGGTTLASMVYGPDGQRLIRKTATETTLYLGGLTEISRTTAGVKTAKRYYQFAGQTIAMRTASDVRFLLGDHHNTTVSTASAYTASIDYQQYAPYGAKRGGDTLTTTQHGFVAQVEDDTTGLNYLNNRYHDPALGVFISVDPLVGATGEPYLYASGNPTTLSDPLGLEAGCGTTAYSSTSCGQAHGAVNSLLNGWLGNSSASAAQTAAAVRDTRRGRVVGSVIDVAHQGDWDKIDGNWSSDDIDDAAAGTNLVRLTGDAAASAIVQSVAARLAGHKDIWEGLDVDRPDGVLRYIHEHVTISYGACLYVCANIKFQGGHLSIAAGELGFSAPGVSVGWASKESQDRERFAIGGQATFILGTGGSIGAWSDKPATPGVDYEQYITVGLGVSFGPSVSWGFDLW